MIEDVMRNSKRVVVGGLAFVLIGAVAARASRDQGVRNQAQTGKIRIVTVVK